ncbi:2692_t:CDS:1, partial [Gigaspora rosea]
GGVNNIGSSHLSFKLHFCQGNYSSILLLKYIKFNASIDVSE